VDDLRLGSHDYLAKVIITVSLCRVEIRSFEKVEPFDASQGEIKTGPQLVTLDADRRLVSAAKTAPNQAKNSPEALLRAFGSVWYTHSVAGAQQQCVAEMTVGPVPQTHGLDMFVGLKYVDLYMQKLTKASRGLPSETLRLLLKERQEVITRHVNGKDRWSLSCALAKDLETMDTLVTSAASGHRSAKRALSEAFAVSSAPPPVPVFNPPHLTTGTTCTITRDGAGDHAEAAKKKKKRQRR